MNDFDYEVRQRKNLANQAKYRKNGRSKKCSLPSDRLTKAQLERKNGKIMTYHLGKPMKWAEFKYMPVEYQKEYLVNLHLKYGATQTDLAAMFGIAPGSLRNFCIRHNMEGIFPPSGKWSAAAIAKWQAFLNGDTVQEAEQSEEQVGEQITPVEQIPEEVPAVEAVSEVVPIEEPAPPHVEDAPVQPIQQESAMKCETSIHMNFSGKFDLDSFVRAISKHIDNGQEVLLNVIGTIREG